MKLKNEIPELKKRIEARKEQIIESAKAFKNRKEEIEYRNFKIAFSWVILRSLYTQEEQMNLSKKYEAKDDHLETFIIKGLEEVIPEIFN